MCIIHAYATTTHIIPIPCYIYLLNTVIHCTIYRHILIVVALVPTFSLPLPLPRLLWRPVYHILRIHNSIVRICLYLYIRQHPIHI